MGPTPSQRERVELARGSPAMTPNPKKRTRSPGSSSRLLAAVQASLTQEPRENQTKQVDASSSQLAPIHEIDGNQTADSMEDDDDDTFFSTRSSPPPNNTAHCHIHPPPSDAHRNPKRQKMERNESVNNMLMSPPMTGGNTFRGYVGVEPASPLKGKGKGNGDVSQWQSIQADQDNPFHERAELLHSTSQAQPCPETPFSPMPSSQSSTVASNATPESIKTLMNEFSSTLPAYIAKLERKQVAAERSNQAKSKKILELEGEVLMLRNKARVLEETVSALKARRPLS